MARLGEQANALPIEASNQDDQVINLVPRHLGRRLPRRAARRRDFLWFMSSDGCLMLPQLLARHGGQVVLLVMRDLAVPPTLSVRLESITGQSSKRSLRT